MSGNVAIVTGGAGNIGRGVCHALTKSGATVVALDIDTSQAEGVGRAIQCDLADADACRAAVEEVVGDFGGINALVNMAQRIIIDTPLLEMTHEIMRISYETGPIATLRMMQLCQPRSRSEGAAPSSTSRRPGDRRNGGLRLGQRAIRGITKTAAVEWGRDNIRVNAICPVAFSQPDSEWGRRSAAGSPMGRVGDPEEDIGSVVVFLAGPGSFINGRTLHVDGGKGGYR